MGAVLLGILIGIDNLAVGSGLGALGLSRERRRLFVAACFVFEALAPVVGVVLGLGMRTRLGSATAWIGPACLAACGLLVLNAVARRRAISGLLDRPISVVLLPLALSLDNLSAGMGLGVSGAGLVLTGAVVGGISAALSAAGLALGGLVRPSDARVAGLLSGSWLVACAAFTLFVDLA